MEVIYCRECVSRWDSPDSGKLWCKAPMGAMGCVMVRPNDFCSRGTRMAEVLDDVERLKRTKSG